MSEHSWSGIAFADLTQPQKDFIKSVVSNPTKSQLLTGCAGSGKTVIASHALSIMRKELSQTVGFLVYTKLLRKFIQDGFQNDAMNNEILHYHKWKQTALPKDLFVIDEAQDFQSEWINIVKSKSLAQIWMGDLSQQIYNDAKQDGGFLKLMNEFESTTHLNVNYRNTLFIAKFASYFMQLNEKEKENGVTLNGKIDDFITPILSNPLQASAANNQPVTLVHASNPSQEYDALAAFILNVKGESSFGTKRIVIAHFQYETLNEIHDELVKRQIDHFQIPQNKDMHDLPDFAKTDLVILSPIHSLKGLEFDYIIFPKTDTNLWQDEDIMNNILYVLFTRAKKRIYCSWVNPQDSVVYKRIKNAPEQDFYILLGASEIIQNGNPIKSESEIEDIIQKHFDEFNL